MFSRKLSNTIRRKKRMIISGIITLVLILGIGYSAFFSDFTINGSLDVAGYMEPTLYNVLKKEAVTGGLAREYTGEHGDSMDSTKSTEKIYHWYAANDTQGTQALDKNNVIFAGQCWQMIRTTDTGGVKMIYNGEAEDGKCLNTRGNHVGYAARTSQSLNSNYWYGTDYIYDPTNKVFSISGTTEQTTWSESTGPGLIGKYTCKGTNETDACATLYLVESYYNAISAYVIPLNGNSHYSQFGELQFNVNGTSISNAGYMTNTRYLFFKNYFTSSEIILSKLSLSTSYWYGDNVTWGNPTVDKYNLNNPYQISSSDDYPSLVGKYTFISTSQTYTSTGVYYIVAVNGSNMYCIQLSNNGNHTLADYDTTYIYGDSYTDNGNGTYTINNPTPINITDWYTSYSNVNNKYVCKNATNDTCSELWYTRETSPTSMTYIKSTNNYKYAKSFEYKLDPDDGTYKYFLDDDTSTSFWNINDNTNKTSLNNAHYTCWNVDGKCTTLSYIYYLESIYPHYINLTNGKDIDDAKNEMLYNDDVNLNNSIIKSGVDAWYKKYILPYDSYVEDTIFCNDRSIRNLNGWNPDGGRISSYLYFKESTVTNDLSCTNTTDKFSVANNLARLTYKVGLMSSPEMNILNNNNARKTGHAYWLFSPYYFVDNAYVRNVNSTGNVNYSYNNVGVRPSVSLTPGTEYSSGDGSMANPYVVQ